MVSLYSVHTLNDFVKTLLALRCFTFKIFQWKNNFWHTVQNTTTLGTTSIVCQPSGSLTIQFWHWIKFRQRPHHCHSLSWLFLQFGLDKKNSSNYFLPTFEFLYFFLFMYKCFSYMFIFIIVTYFIQEESQFLKLKYWHEITWFYFSTVYQWRICLYSSYQFFYVKHTSNTTL